MFVIDEPTPKPTHPSTFMEYTWSGLEWVEVWTSASLALLEQTNAEGIHLYKIDGQNVVARTSVEIQEHSDGLAWIENERRLDISEEEIIESNHTQLEDSGISAPDKLIWQNFRAGLKTLSTDVNGKYILPHPQNFGLTETIFYAAQIKRSRKTGYAERFQDFTVTP